MADSKGVGKATVAIKIIRADGTEQSVHTEEAGLTETKVISEMINKLKGNG